MVIDLPLVVGIAGMFLVLLGFIMILTHRWTADDMAFDFVNLVSSSGLVFYGYVGHAWPFVILNGIFTLYSLKDVLHDVLKKYSKKTRLF